MYKLNKEKYNITVSGNTISKDLQAKKSTSLDEIITSKKSSPKDAVQIKNETFLGDLTHQILY